MFTIAMEKDLGIYQKGFLEEIKQKHDIKNAFPIILSEILNISTDSAYRRLRGQTPLILPEIIKICQHFEVTFSYGSVNPSSPKINFFYKSLCGFENPFEDLAACFNDLKDNLEKIKSDPETIIYLTLTDLPIFYLSNYKELAKFRLKVWFNEMTGQNVSNEEMYSESLTKVTRILGEVQKLLESINSVEIWSDHSINNLIESILYYYQTGELSCIKEADVLFDQLSCLLEDKYKNDDEEFAVNDIYWSEVELSNGYMIAEANGVKLSMIKLFSINSIFTYESVIYDDLKRWIGLRIKNSVLISRSNRKQRHLFFSKMLEKVKQNKARIKSFY